MYSDLPTTFAIYGRGCGVDLITVTEPPLDVGFQFFSVKIFESAFGLNITVGVSGIKPYIGWMERLWHRTTFIF